MVAEVKVAASRLQRVEELAQRLRPHLELGVGGGPEPQRDARPRAGEQLHAQALVAHRHRHRRLQRHGAALGGRRRALPREVRGEERAEAHVPRVEPLRALGERAGEQGAAVDRGAGGQLAIHRAARLGRGRVDDGVEERS